VRGRAGLLAVLTAVAALATACGTDAVPGADDNASHGHAQGAHASGDHAPADFDFGRPGDPENEDRNIKVVAFDALRFEPSRVKVKSGETITFFIRNAGQSEHEFVIGDSAFQKEHEREMAGGHASTHPGGNVVLLDPGKTVRLTWMFTTSGKLLYGCHVPGHYPGGMFGTIKVVDS
jgi:uncharacterized cupredoxin-like copper-binding protein